ncbi:hypothetical protein D3C87_1758860 [compost metagenome]
MAVQAVAQAGGRRAVGKDVSEMGVAVRTANFGAHHEMRTVLDLADRLIVDGGEVARPAAAGIELAV